MFKYNLPQKYVNLSLLGEIGRESVVYLIWGIINNWL